MTTAKLLEKTHSIYAEAFCIDYLVRVKILDNIPSVMGKQMILMCVWNLLFWIKHNYIKYSRNIYVLKWKVIITWYNLSTSLFMFRKGKKSDFLHNISQRTEHVKTWCAKVWQAMEKWGCYFTGGLQIGIMHECPVQHTLCIIPLLCKSAFLFLYKMASHPSTRM